MDFYFSRFGGDGKEPKKFMLTSSKLSKFIENWGLVVVVVLFSSQAFNFMISDLWFDELVTLFDFAVKPHLGDIFLSYPVANNHILFSFSLWIWLHLTQFSTEEILFHGLTRRQ